MIHILPGVDAPYALMTQADLNGLFAFKGVGGVGIRRSGGGSVGGSFGG